MEFKIPEKKFKKDYRLASNIYNTLIVLDDFCSFHNDLESTMNIQPIIKYLKTKATNCFLI